MEESLSSEDGYHVFFQAEDGIRDYKVTGVQTCALPISSTHIPWGAEAHRRAPWPEDWSTSLPIRPARVHGICVDGGDHGPWLLSFDPTRIVTTASPCGAKSWVR